MFSPIRFTNFLVLLVLAAVPTAAGQIGTKLEPRAFEGSPLSARIQGPAPNGTVELFRVYTFNDKGVLQKIEQGTTQMGTTLSVEYTNDKNGRPILAKSSFMGNPTNSIEYAYNDKGQCTGFRQKMIQNDKIMQTVAFEYDDKGNTIRETIEKPGRKPEVLTRTFDDKGRPTKESVVAGDRPVQNVRMEYDDNGCLVKSVIEIPSGRESWSLWIRDENCRALKKQEITFAGVKTEKSFTYDEHGNPTIERITQPDKPGSAPANMVWSYVYPKADTQEKSTEAKSD